MARKAKERTLSGTVEFYSDPYINYRGKRYDLGSTITVTEGETFWLYASVRCTYTQVSRISITVRLLINSHEVCRKFKSVECKDHVTELPGIGCTPTESGIATVELYLGDPDREHELMETRSSWTINVKKACSVSTNKDTYYQGDTVTITYENAPSNSTLSIGAYPSGIPGKSWTVSGNGSILYTIPDDAPTGTWYVYLSDTNCSKTKYITVLASKSPTDLICKDPNKSATVGDTVDLEVELEDKATGVGIDGKWINFYKLVDSTEVSIGSCSTDPNGKCSITYTCSVEETATIKAKFRGDDDYKASECTFTITVSSKPTCNQSFRVVEEEDTSVRVPNSVVIVREKGTAKELGRCTTDSNGECTVKDIEEGVWCVAEASAPSGYEVISDSSTEFVACTSIKTLKLRSTTCKQRVKVIDPAGNPIEGATVAIDMGTYSILCKKPDGSGYGTDANGDCDLCNLEKRTVYLACASKEGYKHYGGEGCKWFTACYGWALILKLYKPCEQQFLVLDQDNKPIVGATVTVTPGDKTCTTDSNGVCKISDLAESVSYTAEATKEGYKTFDSESKKSFKCTPYTSIVLRLEKVRRPYEIRITVKDEQGHGIKHAYVSVTKEIFEGTWQEVPCSDITVH
ncbi:MAG: carboxypeptidase regulatory-like domain-containing protein, partial [Methanophagales archaeon]|nr:carboxypeptidase regulatory-like domain-containing protein [Methanophagales archaeon]